MTFAEAGAPPATDSSAAIGAGIAAAVLLAAAGIGLYHSRQSAAPVPPPVPAAAPLVEVRLLAPEKPIVPPEAPEPVIAEPIERRALPKEWRLRGTVYDLLTLKGLAGCALVFTNDYTSTRFETSTDEEGRYRMILPPIAEEGYTLKISLPDYLPSFYSGGKRNYGKMSEASRRAAARSLAGAVPPPTVLSAPGAAPVVTDFYLAPVSLPPAEL